MDKALKSGALIVFVPLLACCAVALKCYLGCVRFVYGRMDWELAWPPVERVEQEAEGEARHCRSRRR
jgi:hypothetical protein